MPTKHCAFDKCNSDNRYPQNGVTFIPFAKPGVNKEKCLRWIEASQRDNLTLDDINKYTYVCSKHFVGGNGPTRNNPDPIPATESDVPQRRPSKRPSHIVDCPVFVKTERLDSDNEDENQSHHAWLRDTSVEIKCKEESIDLPEDDPMDEEDEPVVLKYDPEDDEVDPKDDPEDPVVPEVAETSLPVSRKVTVAKSLSEDRIVTSEIRKIKRHLDMKRIKNELKIKRIKTKNAECQTVPKKDSTVERLEREIILLRKKVGSGYLRVESCKEFGIKFKFYTGLTYEEFGVLWQFLGSPTILSIQFWLSTSGKANKIKHRKHNLTLQNQLFLTLVRLRRGFLIKDLSYRFGLNNAQVSEITTTWIQLMYTQFKKLDIFPTAEATRKTGLPKIFKNMTNLRILINIFQVSIERKYRGEQRNKYSTSRYRDTGKFLIGIEPTGDCCFLSDCFKGRISDREIIRRSGLFDALHKKDLILTERDFNITDLCFKHSCKVMRWPVPVNRRKTADQEVKRNKNVDAKRLSVKKFIRRIKQFQFLQRTIPIKMVPMLPQIVFVIAMLVHFQPVIA